MNDQPEGMSRAGYPTIRQLHLLGCKSRYPSSTSRAVALGRTTGSDFSLGGSDEVGSRSPCLCRDPCLLSIHKQDGDHMVGKITVQCDRPRSESDRQDFSLFRLNKF